MPITNFIVDLSRIQVVVDCFHNLVYQHPAYVSVIIVHEPRTTLGFVLRPVIHLYAPYTDEGYDTLVDVNQILGNVGIVEGRDLAPKKKHSRHAFYMLRITRYDAVEHTLKILQPLVNIRQVQIGMVLDIINTINQHRAGANMKLRGMTPKKFLDLCIMVDELFELNHERLPGYVSRGNYLNLRRKWSHSTVQDYFKYNNLI